MVPKHIAHLQPLDFIMNGAIKMMKTQVFSEYFTDCIRRELLRDLGKGVTTIDVN